MESGGASKKALATIAIATALAIVGAALAGRPGACASILVSFPIAAWRHDNDVGACFPLAILAVVLILIIVLLLALMGWLWALHQ